MNTTLPLILNIVGFFFCGAWTCVGGILFVVGFIFSLQARSMAKVGNLEGARGKAKTAVILAIVGAVLGLVGSAVVGIMKANGDL